MVPLPALNIRGRRRDCDACGRGKHLESRDQFLRGLFEAALAAVEPRRCVARHGPGPPPDRTVVVGAGKASAAMALALENGWDRPLNGAVVVPYGHAVPCQRIEVIEAAHPLPDEASAHAARRMLGLVAGLTADDLVIALISGGGSALLALPAPGVSQADKRAVTDALLRSGAAIHEINAVRKHLSAIKGGRLALAARPAHIETLVISDVPGDDPAVVASGPTLPDSTTLADAMAVLARYRIDPPAAVMRHLAQPDAETPKPGHPAFAGSRAVVIARARDALDAAAAWAADQGIRAIVLGDDLQGEARTVARDHAVLALNERDSGRALPAVILSGGETTVTHDQAAPGGRGGRNTEYALALALALDGASGIHALACDTDGIDGASDAAGALIGPDCLTSARAKGLDPRTMLDTHDSATLFDALGALVVTGPTRTNVNDFRAILIEEGG